MAEPKECFGQCANVSIRYRNMSHEHYLYVDEEKYRECADCPWFAQCLFQRYNTILRDLIRLVDRQGKDDRPRLG